MRAGIAGAGLMGRLLANKLIDSGWEVSLFDNDKRTGELSCGMTAAGMLAPHTELENTSELITTLGEYGIREWPRIISQLDASIYFQQKGSIVTAHNNDQADLEQYGAIINSKSIQKSLYRTLDLTQLTQLEPELNKTYKSYYFPLEAQLDNQQLMQALEHKLTAKNVHWHEQTTVTAVKPHKIILANATHAFDRVFDCRGLGAKQNFPTLRGIRGEMIWLHAPAVQITRPVRLLHPRYRLYLVPRPNNIYLVGASEIESNDMSTISVRTMLEFLSTIYSLHAGFIEARIIKTMVNCRPTLPNNLPKIYYTDGLLAINGLYRHGFLITPALINEIDQFLQQGIGAVNYPTLWEQHRDHNPTE